MPAAANTKRERFMFVLFTLIVLGFAAPSIALNTWDLLHQRLPKYYINRFFLSGTLLLYDRPMFFESRAIEIRTRPNSDVQVLEYDLHRSEFQSYLERRLFRFATNETNCGADESAAFETLFCQSAVNVLKEKDIDSVTVRFTPHFQSGAQRHSRTGARLKSRVERFFTLLVRNKYRGVRITSGLFAAYFFAAYFSLANWFWIFKFKGEATILNSALITMGQENSVLAMRLILALLLITSVLFTLGRWVRICALVIWIGYTLFYNFFVCINQPFMTYFIHCLLTFVFLSNESFCGRKSPADADFRGCRFLFVLALVYMTQMTISGFSKTLSPEWRAGETLSLMLHVHDPEPGLRYLGIFPPDFLKCVTWFTLFLECGSFLYLFVPRLRTPIWVGHVLMYAGIVVFVPHATHVAVGMLIFQWLILVRPSRTGNDFLN